MSLAVRRAAAWVAGAALLAPVAAESASARTLPAATAVDLGGLETRSAALLLSAQEAGDLEVSVAAVALPDAATAGAAAAGGMPATDRSRVLLVVDFAGASLLAGLPERAPAAGARDAGGSLIIEIYAYALDARGGLADTLTRAFRLDLEASRGALAESGVKFFGHLDLPPGEYSLRVLAQQRRSGRLGLEVLPLSVPSWSGGAAVLLPPLAHEEAGRWLLVFEEGEPPPPFPLTIDGEPRVPATRWRVEAGGESGYLLLGRELGDGMRSHLLDEAFDELLELGIGDLRAVDGAPGGLDAVAATLDATGLEGGEYRLSISSPAGAESSSPLTIGPAEDRSLWAGAESGPAAGRPPGARRRGALGGGSRAQQERVDSARAAYLKTFASLEAGDRRAMLRPLVELERAGIGGGESFEQKRLGEAELRAAWELAGGDAEGLLPMIWIHGELYRQYHAHGRYQLATHSRRVLAGLAEVYLERRPSAEARHLVACALAGIAGHLQGLGALPAAQEAWEAVLAVEPEHPAGLIGLATVAESYGDYQAVVQLLERLRGGSSETRVSLRLGVNLRRLGKDRRAERLLRESLEAPGPVWVAAVAAQELASLLAAHERFGEAIAVLEAAIERHPDVQRLRLQLAALFDRAGRLDAARAVLAGLDPAAGRGADSPRLRYSRMPTQALAEARRTLSEEARRRLPRLLAAPEGGPRGGAR